jgi:hypothetical protein
MPGGHDGLYRGMVTDIDDPEGLNRVRLMVPQLFGRAETGWAWPSQPAEITSLPAVGGVVWVLFEAGHQDRPVWVGTWSVSVRPVHDHPYVAKAGDEMTGPLVVEDATVAKVSRSSYPGDDATWRTIVLPFTPGFVVVTNRANGYTFYSGVSAQTDTAGVSSTGTTVAAQVSDAGRPRCVTNGFVVSGGAGGTNVSGDVYDFFAVG